MDTLYYLALFQGVLFCYKLFLSHATKGLSKVLLPEPVDDNEHEVVLVYCNEIRIGCEKDPSFARGRNLVTHAVDMIGSNSCAESLYGVKMLYTAICMGERKLKEARVKGDEDDCATRWTQIIGQRMIMKNLNISASSAPVLQKLLQTLDPRGAFDRETRSHGATIVAYLAMDIHLEQFPGEIQYISSLIGSFEEYRLIEPYHRDRLLRRHDQDWDRQASRLPSPGNDASSLREAYEKLVLTGLCILRKLATHENNCRIMSQTQGLIPKIMAPLTSDIIHRFSGGAWSASAVEESLKVMFRLVAAPGETGVKLRQEISSNKEAISTMERILNCECDTCCAKLQKGAMGILMQLRMDNPENIAAFIKMLVDIFVDDTKDRSIRNLAGESLAKLSIQGGSNTSIIVQLNGDIVGSLIKILLLDDAENNTCRVRAAEILEQMCIHHTQDDDTLGKLKKGMTDTMPKVLAQILHCGLTKDETHGLTETEQIEFPEKEIDIENQQHNVEDETCSFIQPQNNDDEGEVEVEMDMEVDELDNEEDEEVHAPLLSLFVTVCDTFISADQDLASQFGAVDAVSLPNKLKDMVAENSIPTVPCLRLMKLACKMVISMMKHRGRYLKEDLESLTEALSSASESMSLVDVSMVFASEDDGAATTMKPVRSLDSLVKEAKESVDAYFKAQESGNIEPFTSIDG
ncbi:uncharacterized protein [Lolium perenne]|uniref:uncharacterized protein n=1 Tax=Lolium perenne TaxID=4522 RepID=UPI0021F59CE3|nr:uncharacterized protein LOC127304672 [Lolium perenne]